MTDAAGFIAQPDSGGAAELFIALPDGSHLVGTTAHTRRAGNWAKVTLATNVPWRMHPSSFGNPTDVTTKVRAMEKRLGSGAAMLVEPCVVAVPDELTVQHSEDLVRSFCEAVDDGKVQQTIPTLRRFTRTYELSVFNGANGAPRQERMRVEDRAPALKLPAGETLTRPNGEIYLPRILVDHTDAAVLRKAREASMYALLRGNPGTGKTALADATFPDLVPVACTGDTTTAHLVGSWLPNPDGTFRWVDGPLTTAMREGRPLLLDEIDRLAHEVSSIVFSAMDGRRLLRIDDRPDLPLVQAADGFYVIGTYNPRNLGGQPLPEALLSRFAIQVEVGTDHDACEALGVPEKFVALSRNLSTQAAQSVADGGEPIWSPETRELLAAQRLIAAGFGEAFALAAMIDACPVPEDLTRVRAEAKSIFGFSPDRMSLGGRA